MELLIFTWVVLLPGKMFHSLRNEVLKSFKVFRFNFTVDRSKCASVIVAQPHVLIMFGQC